MWAGCLLGVTVTGWVLGVVLAAVVVTAAVAVLATGWAWGCVTG